MIKRCAQTLCRWAILALPPFLLLADGQQIKTQGEVQSQASGVGAAHKGFSSLQRNYGSSRSSDVSTRTIEIGGLALAGPAQDKDKSFRTDSTQPPSTPRGLTYEQAVQLAIATNLTTLLARERRNQAHGAELESLSGLLTNIGGVASQSNLTTNLAAQGLTHNSFPLIRSTLIGPYNSFFARFELAQTLFNLSAIRTYQAGRTGVAIAAVNEELARQQVVASTALAYLNALRTERALAAAEANLLLAETLLKLANDQHRSGVANGLDVTRAQTRLAQQQFRLAQAKTDIYQARLQLQRVTGLPLGEQLVLTDKLTYIDESLPDAQGAVDLAERQRVEIRLAIAQVKLSDYERRSAFADHLPSVDFVSYYGSSGVNPGVLDLPTRGIGIRIVVPIFDGGLTRGRVGVATSKLRQAEMQLNDQRKQVDEDVRLALETIATAAEQVRAAEQTRILAERELQMARDRFAAGLGDNIEVVNAQAALADARDSEITALSAHTAARINLASAMGRVESFHW